MDRSSASRAFDDLMDSFDAQACYDSTSIDGISNNANVQLQSRDPDAMIIDIDPPSLPPQLTPPRPRRPRRIESEAMDIDFTRPSLLFPSHLPFTAPALVRPRQVDSEDMQIDQEPQASTSAVTIPSPPPQARISNASSAIDFSSTTFGFGFDLPLSPSPLNEFAVRRQGAGPSRTPRRTGGAPASTTILNSRHVPSPYATSRPTPRHLPARSSPTTGVERARRATAPNPMTAYQLSLQPGTWEQQDFRLKMGFKFPRAIEKEVPPQWLKWGPPAAFYEGETMDVGFDLKVFNKNGLQSDILDSVQIGFTSLLELFDDNGQSIGSRIIFDMALPTNAVKEWKAEHTRRNLQQRNERPHEPERLPHGTYTWRFSLKVGHNSARMNHVLIPSHKTAHYKISHKVSVALISSRPAAAQGYPAIISCTELDYHILPCMAPDTRSPRLAKIEHRMPAATKRQANVMRDRRWNHFTISPQLETLTFSPAGRSKVPINLKIEFSSGDPHDIFIRLSLVKRVYMRRNRTTSLEEEMMDIVEPAIPTGDVEQQEQGWVDHMKEETEVVSRWTWMNLQRKNLYDSYTTSFKDIWLPFVPDVAPWTWTHGYTTRLDLEPHHVPSKAVGASSWFSPSFQSATLLDADYSEHTHCSTRFFLLITAGFASQPLQTIFENISYLNPDIHIPKAFEWTDACAPTLSNINGASLTDPFSPIPPNPKVPSYHTRPSFPGEMRTTQQELLISSVSEPNLAVVVDRMPDSARRQQDEFLTLGEDEDLWRRPPPDYQTALRSEPQNEVVPVARAIEVRQE
ncbi:hypothetical protein BT69DRAFT_1348862 [Atractiella rhizophila]|nr:hypothetical protein BT69DRAFT_1348862 [Atractiella rhizophila]